MDKIKCPHCHKTFPMSEAIRHELEEKVRVEQTEKLKELHKLKDDGLISQEEFEAKKAEIISESGLKDL